MRAYLFGELRLVVNGRLAGVPAGRRSRNVLAYLLLHGDAPVPQEVLMDTFWPDARPAAARNSLHVALSGARRALREATTEPIIERRFDAYRIAPAAELWTDVDEFERGCEGGRRAIAAGDGHAAIRRFEAALLLMRGDFLADDPGGDWAATRREALRATAIEARGRLVTLYAGAGDYGPAATLGRRVLADDPCNEDVHRALMLCYAGTGLRHLALLQFRDLAGALWDQLRVRPTAETIALYERLRRPEQVPRPA
jgi:SARP family transcriptional regulator, regulator of embCAB operon